MTITKLSATLRKKLGINGIIREGVRGIQWIEYGFTDSLEYFDALNVCRKIKSVHIEENPYTESIRIFIAADYSAWQTAENEKFALVNGFWETLHNSGKSAADKYYSDNIELYRKYGIA